MNLYTSFLTVSLHMFTLNTISVAFSAETLLESTLR